MLQGNYGNKVDWRRSGVSLVFVLGVLAFLPGLSQCEQNCYDIDEDGNRTVFECVTCVERDADSCTVDSWRLPPGSTCSLDQQPVLDDGETCQLAGAPGVCASGACEPVAYIEAGSGSTTWRATTDEFATEGGCDFSTPVLHVLILFDTTITMTVVSDGLGNLTVDYDVAFQHFVLPTLATAAEFGDLSLTTRVIGGTPSTFTSTVNPAATGQAIGAFMSGDVMSFSSPDEILTVTQAVTPTSSPTVNVNWSGEFTISLTLGGEPLMTVTDAKCVFDIQGAGVDFAVIQP